MNFLRIKSIVLKEWKRTIREPSNLFMIILFPIVLTLTFSLAFGGIGGSTTTTFNVGYVNLNEGGVSEHWATYFEGNLTETEILVLTHYTTNASAQNDLVQGRISAVIVVPEDFGESIDSYFANPSNPATWTNTSIELDVDAGSLFARAAISPLIQQTIIKTMFGEQILNNPMPITLGLGSMVEVNAINTFDVMAPGLLAFAVMFLTMTIAQSIVNERQKGLLKRLDTTPLTASEFISGQTIANALVAGIQVAIVLLIAFLTWYSPNTGIGGILLAIILSIIFSISAISFGLIVGSIAKNDGSATLLSFVFILPQMMLGSFIPIPGDIGKFVPSYYITDAVTSIFLRGAPIFSPAIIEDLIILSAFAVGTFVIGMILFKKTGKK